jgi:general secretion pathway protein A
VVLLGQPELRELLARPELRQLSQRITARYHLGPLERGEVAAYINHRLAVAGHRKKLFNDQVIGLVYRYTGGIPRLINVLCDRALLGTYVQGLDKVSAATLKTAAREVLGPEISTPPSGRSRQFRLILALLLAALVGGGLTAGWQYQAGLLSAPSPPEPPQIPVSAPIVAVPPPVTWPETLDSSASRESAFTSILALWGIDYVSGSEACHQAEAGGLACLHRKGNLGSLLRLNRPAVLTMLNANGEEFSVALTSIEHGVASLTVADREVQIPTDQLERNWTGAYIIIWRPPPGFSQVIRPDRTGPARDWLTARIADLSGKKLTGAELADAVEKYQQAEGILADGVAGPETIIHLNTSTGQPVVLLTRN